MIALIPVDAVPRSGRRGVDQDHHQLMTPFSGYRHPVAKAPAHADAAESPHFNAWFSPRSCLYGGFYTAPLGSRMMGIASDLFVFSESDSRRLHGTMAIVQRISGEKIRP